MSQRLPNVTDAEWAVLNVLWDRGPATARQLREALYPQGGPSEHATVHKLLERLEGKECVRRERQAEGLVFRAIPSRDALVGQQLEAVLDKACAGSLQPLLTNLIRTKRLTAEELRDLLALVDNLDPQAKPRKERR